MSDGKYRIEKAYFAQVWLLSFPDGQCKSFLEWRFAVAAMRLDAARQAAVNNRIPLGPIGTVKQSDEIPRAGRSI